MLAGGVRALIVGILKATRAVQMYVPGNALIERFLDEARALFREQWKVLPHITLTVDEGRLLWKGHEVYSATVGPDNFAFQFFKDGIRLIAFLPGAEVDELPEFLSLLATGRGGKENPDVLAALWHRDFSHIRFEYVQAPDEDPELPQSDRRAGAGEQIADMSEIEEVRRGEREDEDTRPEGAAGPADSAGPRVSTQTAREQIRSLTLSDGDRTYLRREMQTEWARELRRDVALALLDQFEMRDQERRLQVVDIVRDFLPRLLRIGDLSNVALIITELQLLANKTGELTVQELVASLLRDMSEALADRVGAAAGAGTEVESADIEALLGALQAEAIPSLVRAIPTVADARLQRQMADSLDRLIAAHPGHVRSLLHSEDPMLAAEAARMVTRLGFSDAEPDLVDLAAQSSPICRLAAIEAIEALQLRSAGAVLLRGLEDADREVRVAAVRAIGTLRPAGAESVLEREIAASSFLHRDPAEQMTFFKAYALAGGEKRLQTLDRLLNGRRWWGGRKPVALRSLAARALAVVGGPEARDALQRAAADRNPQVQSAVRVALRSTGDGVGGDHE